MLKLLTLLLAAGPIIYVTSLVSLDIESYRHEYNADIFKLLTVELVNFTDHLGVNGSVMLSQDLEDIMVTYYASVPKVKGKEWKLLNVTINACELLNLGYRKSLSVPYMILNVMKSSSKNFPDKCPVKKDREMAFFDLHLDAEKFHMNFPEIKFNGILTMHSKNVFLYRGYGRVAVTSKDKKQRLG